MINTRKCIDNYIAKGFLNNIAIRVGTKDKIIGEIYRSTEKSIDNKTLFDMASVTKIMATTSVCLIALDMGLLKTSDKVSSFFDVPEDKKELTIKHLLTHTIGYGHKGLNKESNNYDNIAKYILDIPLDSPVGCCVLYSCPGFILLGKILEKVFGKRLDKLFDELVAEPLGMTDSSFCPNKDGNFVNSNINENETGIVNDYNCRHLGCVAGNAGLFSNTEDVNRYVNMLLNYGEPITSKETFLEACKNHTKGLPGDSRGLGFLYVDEKYDQTGKLFPIGSIGHCGHTGQSVFVNLNSGLFVTILSDATVSVTKKTGCDMYDIVKKMREDLHNAIYEDLIAINIIKKENAYV